MNGNHSFIHSQVDNMNEMVITDDEQQQNTKNDKIRKRRREKRPVHFTLVYSVCECGVDLIQCQVSRIRIFGGRSTGSEGAWIGKTSVTATAVAWRTQTTCAVRIEALNIN